jgi:hypothetical protein
LVVVAMISLLLGLTFPALARFREAGAKTSCTNNLRQLGLAMQLHLQVRGAYAHGGWSYLNPPTYYNDNGQIGATGTPGRGARQLAGWGFQLMPYLELEAPYESGAVDSVSTTAKVFFCPLRGGPRWITGWNGYPDNPAEGQYPLPSDTPHGATDYASVYVDADPEQSGVIVRAKIAPGAYQGNKGKGKGQGKPLAPLAQFASVASVKDGASNTLLLAEKCMNVRQLGEAQLDDNQGFTSGWGEFDTNRCASLAPLPDYQDRLYTADDLGNSAVIHRLSALGSSHSGGFSVVFADARALQLSFGIARDVLEKLGGRNNGIAKAHEYDP